MVRRIIAWVVAAGLLLLALLLSHQTDEELQVSGFIEADDIQVGSRVGGRVRKLWVREGQQVNEGDVLV